jgi:hypothetical protein
VFSSVPESSSSPPSILGDEMASGCLYLVTKPSHMGGRGVDVDGLAYPLHRPMACRCQLRGHGLTVRRYPILSSQ